ncbi:hypothetical protein J4437_02415 [Candidatus Woesearchaeota archaeon]|nr:hypothetical protein [Candidatus Woesearchaeota archaeon]
MIGKLRKKKLGVKETKVLKHRIKILGLGAAVLAWLVLMVSLGQFSILGNAVQTISYAPIGSELNFEIRNVPGLSSAVVQFKDTVKGGRIIFNENKDIGFNGLAFSKIVVSSDVADKLSIMRLTMKVSNKDLNAIGLNPYELKLYVNGKEKQTTFVEIKDNYNYYSASTTELGNFVLGKRKLEPVISSHTVQAKVQVPISEEPAVSESLPLETTASGMDIEETATGSAIELPVEEAPQSVGIFGAIKNFLKGLFN